MAIVDWTEKGALLIWVRNASVFDVSSTPVENTRRSELVRRRRGIDLGTLGLK